MVKQDRFSSARALFNEICAGCHALADAGAKGTRFNLDNDPMLNPELVRASIREGAFGMPAWEGVLPDSEIDALADYITAVAKRGHGDDGWAAEHARRDEGEPPHYKPKYP